MNHTPQLLLATAILLPATGVFADDPVPSYLGNANTANASHLNTASHWSGGVVPLNGDWQTDDTLRILSNSQTRLPSEDMTFANFTHGATDLTDNPRFEILATPSGTYGIFFSSVNLLQGAIPFALTNNNGIASFNVSGNLTVDTEMRIGRDTAAATSNISSWGSVAIGGTTSVGDDQQPGLDVRPVVRPSRRHPRTSPCGITVCRCRTAGDSPLQKLNRQRKHTS